MDKSEQKNIKNDSTMSDINAFRVLKSQSNTFLIDYYGKIVSCSARKKVKKLSDIAVGDYVSISNLDGAFTIESVQNRKNFLIRPSVANIDQIIIILAAVPQIDYFLVDKLLINARKQNLNTIICINKSDLTQSIYEQIYTQFAPCVDKIISVSALNAQIEPLRAELCGKLSCLAGQSAVGKSTIINALTGDNRQQIGDLSQKILRGKNTTTSAEIIRLQKDTYIIDTPGFSSLDVHDLDFSLLEKYYPEFEAFSQGCKYRGCSHTHEPDCEVARQAANNKINNDRFERYKIIYSELKAQKKY